MIGDGGPYTSQITVDVRDQSDAAHPVPNGTLVRLETTEGVLGNGQPVMDLTAINGDYPNIDRPGNLNPEDTRYGPLFQGFLQELEGEEAALARIGLSLSFS